MLQKIRKQVTPFIDFIGKRLNINPNIVSGLAFLAAGGACWCFWKKSLLVGGILVLLNGFLDWLDGSIAKLHGRITLTGEVLDAIIDKYSECFILLALGLSGVKWGWVSLAIIGVMLTTYVQARIGEAVGKKKVFETFGILERPDRALLIGVGAILSYFNPQIIQWVIIFVAIFSNITALQRFYKGWKYLSQNK